MAITPEQVASIAKRHNDAAYSSSFIVRQAVLEGAIREAVMLDRQASREAPVHVYTIEPAILEWLKARP